jgi:hypothetical protein
MGWIGWTIIVSFAVFSLYILAWVLARVFRRDRHVFDLKNPEMQNTHGYSWPRFRCKRCGKTLGLDRWQMKSLPREMAYGCPGHPLTINDHIDAVNECLREKMED